MRDLRFIGGDLLGRRYAIAGMVLLSLLSLSPLSSANGEEKKGPPAMRVVVDLVRAEPLAQTVPVIGRLVPRRAGVVAARTSGPVDAFLVDVGDVVKPGDIIATLDANTLDWQAKLMQAQTREQSAKVQTASSRVALLKQELDRIKRLKTSSAFSQAALDDKEQEVTIAQSQIAEYRAAMQVARANQELAEIELSRANITAPYGGIVTQRHTEAGAYVNAGDEIISMIAPDTLEIEADVPTQRISAARSGADVIFVLADGVSRTAFVRAVVPDENPLTRTRRVRFTADLPIGTLELAANQSATVYLPLGAPRDVVSVHKDAVLNRGGKTLVFVVGEDGTATMRPVSLNEAVGQRFEVVSGLEVGEQVVIRGNERLRPGQAVDTGLADTSDAS